MDVTPSTLLQNLHCSSAGQATVVIANTQPITELLAAVNNLGSADVDAILVALDGNGLNNGTVDLSGQTPIACPSAVGVAAGLSLTGKGWTVTYDLCTFILDDGMGGFWQLIVDTSGNVGTQSVAGPASPDIILDDGGGGFWKVVVDTIGNRGTVSDLGPATAAPVLYDGVSTYWELVVDTSGNLGASSI